MLHILRNGVSQNSMILFSEMKIERFWRSFIEFSGWYLVEMIKYSTEYIYTIT